MHGHPYKVTLRSGHIQRQRPMGRTVKAGWAVPTWAQVYTWHLVGRKVQTGALVEEEAWLGPASLDAETQAHLRGARAGDLSGISLVDENLSMGVPSGRVTQGCRGAVTWLESVWRPA